MEIKNKRAGMSLSIVLLVFAIIVLLVICLVYFQSTRTSMQNTFASITLFENVYSEEALLDFYLGEIVKNMDREDVVSNFSTEFKKYADNPAKKYPLPAFMQVQQQIDSNHIRIENGVLKVDFDIVFYRIVLDSDVYGARELFRINYNKKFRYEEKI